MNLCELWRRIRIPLWLVILMTCGGIIGGLLGGFMLTFQFGNYHAGTWSFLSAIPALWCLHLHSLHYYKSLDVVHSSTSLKVITHCSSAISMVSFLAALTYLTLALLFRQPLFPINHSFVLAAVQASLNTKWHLILRYHAKRYRMLLDEGYFNDLTVTESV